MVKDRLSKEDCEAIRKSVANWPQWKKDYCNVVLILSPKAKKI